jgi:putative methyltransferase (TIGR04325 family)
MDFKKTLKPWIPPAILSAIKRKPVRCFSGNYSTWEEAVSDSTGYDDPQILEKVKESLLKVRGGVATFERDSVLFKKIEHSWPVLTGLLWSSAQSKNELHILDFGGSLGSHYFQNKAFLGHLQNIKWNIVEQKNFVECGKKYFEDNHLSFYDTIEESLEKDRSNVFLASGSVQFLEKPYNFLSKVEKSGFDFIIFDRTTFLKDEDRLTVQHVPKRIYEASYPAWFLNEQKFLGVFHQKYELTADWDLPGGGLDDLGDAETIKKGYIFRKKI